MEFVRTPEERFEDLPDYLFTPHYVDVYHSSADPAAAVRGKRGTSKVGNKQNLSGKKYETAAEFLDRTSRKKGKRGNTRKGAFKKLAKNPDSLILKAYGNDMIDSAVRKGGKQARPMPKSHKRKVKAKSKGQKIKQTKNKFDEFGLYK